MAIKLIDPNQREIWTHPEDEDFKVEYRAVAIPTMTGDLFVLGKKYLEAGITRVWNPDPVSKPSVGGWCSILPSDVQTSVFVAVQALSTLTESEEQD